MWYISLADPYGFLHFGKWFQIGFVHANNYTDIIKYKLEYQLLIILDILTKSS